MVDSRYDLPALETRRALRDFANAVRDADIAVVYYAGHGIEVDGANYLIPVDAKLERDADVYDETLSLDRVLVAVDPAKQLRLVILDACRDNPFTRSMKRALASRGIGRGLAQIEPSIPNTLVAYSAKAGSTAQDGDGSNSPFTIALSQRLTTPGLDVRRALGFVRDDVLKSTGNRQEPFVYGSLGGEDVPLVPVKAAPSASSAPPPQAEMRHDYELALQIGNKEAFNFFLAQYPDGYYANLAKLQLAKIAAEETRAAATEKARLAQQEQARLAYEGAQQLQLAKAASDLRAAEDARVAAEKAKETAQEQAAQAEQRRAAADAAAAKNVAPVSPDRPRETKVDAKIAALPAPEAPAPPPQAEVAKLVQAELRRVGCFTGSANGEWDAASRRSLELFNQHAGTKFDVKAASVDVLDAIKLKPARVCPLICASGFKRDGDRCVRIACAPGYFVNDDNECEKRKVRQSPSARYDRSPSARQERREAPATPKAEASAGDKPKGGGMPFIPFFLP
ncbi:hypothetical protein GCM10007857_25410 [Bradyrhizobium iriomotense]|uniref:Caspase family p20 domain-containing protein n=1 Tax=Bradyrhizobium iriomotense TaxID=441950 RepID=A0ABQ6AWN3_9BRAD|nr:hypothetical protein GCM10007857_25410 [Bradyrhizobium iriomotense]